MKDNTNYDNLFVGFPVYDQKYETEPFVQYESFGEVRHTIIVSPQRVLIGSITNENGDTRYYDYKTGKAVREKNYESSFYSHSSATMSVYSSFVDGQYIIGQGSFMEFVGLCCKSATNEVGYLVPISEFAEDKFGLSLDEYSPSLASKLVTLANLTSRRKGIALSFYSDDAKKQLEKIGYHSDKEKAYSKK